MQSDGIKAINLNCIQEVIEFCLYEISLQGLEGIPFIPTREANFTLLVK
jgi:hypothetical protein